MNIKILNIVVDEQFVLPTLKISVEIEYNHSLELPISISGHLIVGGKIISQLIETSVNSDATIGLKLLTQGRKNGLKGTANSNYTHRTYLTAVLNEITINHVENFREKQTSKSVQFHFNFIWKYLTSPIDFHNLEGFDSSDFISLRVEKPYADYEIKHSDWVNSFAPKLGLGNFLLVELRIPDEVKISSSWNQLYSALAFNVKEMEKCIREGDWPKTMLFGRKYFENLKIGDNKPAHKDFKDMLDALLKNDQHSEEGIKNLYMGIWQFFEFISKFIHDKDKNGNLITRPIPTKEDAYFAYSLGLGLLNLIGKKLHES